MNYYMVIYIIYVGHYEDALAFVNIRRDQTPVVYNRRRCLEAPLPDVSFPAQAEIHGFEEEQPIDVPNDILREHDPLNFEKALMNGVAIEGNNIQREPIANSSHSISESMAINIPVTVEAEINSNKEEQSIDIPIGTREKDPLSTDEDDARIKEEDLSVFKLDEADRDEVDGILNEAVQHGEDEINDAEDVVGIVLIDPDVPNDDVDIEFIGEVIPMPMSSMRHGMIKHEDDDISGGLPYKPTVRFSMIMIFYLC